MNSLTWVFRIIAACILATITMTASAVPVRFAFKATVISMWEFDAATQTFLRPTSSYFPGALVQINDVYSGTFYYDRDAALLNMAHDNGRFYVAKGPSQGASFRNASGDIVYDSSQYLDNGMFFGVIDQGPGPDILQFTSYAHIGLGMVNYAEIDFTDTSGTALDGYGIPLNFNLADFDFPSLRARYEGRSDGNDFTFDARITELHALVPQQIPEPSGLPMFLGMAAFAALFIRKTSSR